MLEKFRRRGRREVNAALTDGGGCRRPPEYFLVSAFVSAHGLIAGECVFSFKVVVYPDIASFIGTMSGKTREAPEREGRVRNHFAPSEAHPFSNFLRIDIRPLKVFSDDEKASEREEGDL
jgi:hypothetical protein